MQVYSGLSGQTYHVGDALSDEAIGAEGSICEIEGKAMGVAKIYHDGMTESESIEIENKLKLMIDKKIVETHGVFSIAWPRDVLYKVVDGKRIFAGYTMRRVSASYNLSDLTHHKPDDPDLDPNGIDGYITWREFIQAAYNLSRLVEYLHKNGIEIGDFNERNFLFDENTGGFDLIDCGTYGIFDTKTLKTIYPCRYSMPKYSAPEKLLGLGISDPKSTDCFYLAIHIFHLLMQNSEPFGYKENSDGNPIAKLHEHIANGDCLYVKSIPGKALRKHSIKPGILPDDILEAFNRTFNYTRDNIASRIKNRPTASEWCKVLEPYLTDESKIIKCPVKKEHVYSSHLTECPWCNPSTVSAIPFEQRVNSSTERVRLGGEGAKRIYPNDPCPCGSGKKYKNCHGKMEESAAGTSSKLAEACDILAKTMNSGDDYYISNSNDANDILITLNGIRKIEAFFNIKNINDPESEQIEKEVRNAICRKEQKIEDDDDKAVAKVQRLIDSIGKVSYTEECRKKISTARIAFSNLTVPQRVLVSTDKLSKAEAEYKALEKQAESNKKKKRSFSIAASVIAALLLIGVIIGHNLKSDSGENSKTANTDITSNVATSIDEQKFISNNIDTLNAGLSEGKYKQVVFGRLAVYCLNNDGTIKIYATDQDDETEKQTEYSSWSDIASIVLIPNSVWYEESIIGLKEDGTVLTATGAKVYQGELDVSDWNNIVQIDASNGEAVLGLRSDGTVLYTPSTREAVGSASFSDVSGWYGCKKVVSVQTKDVKILGLSTSGTILDTNYSPYALYYHGEWGSPYLSWGDLKDISVCSLSTDIFGLTEDGNVLYGGVFGYSGELIIDEDEVNSWSGVTAISTGSDHLVALKSDGTVYAAGDNKYGQCDVGGWKDIVRVEACESSTVGFSSNGSIYFTGYNCLEKALSELKSEETSSESKSIHYYNTDLSRRADGTYAGSFGPDYWASVKELDSENQLFETSKEFFTRINSDPVMAAACLAYVDRVMGTSYTGEYYSSISDNWVGNLNEIADSFINDSETWNNDVQALISTLNGRSVDIE